MEPIITYRLTETGIWSYHFYSGRKMIGKATSVLSLSSLVRIESSSVSWYSTFHVDTEIFPGISRKVMDDRTGLEVYRVIFCEPGFYRMDRRGDEPAGGMPGERISVWQSGRAGAGRNKKDPGMAVGAGGGAFFQDDGV